MVAPALDASFTADDFILLRYSTVSSIAESFRYFLTDWGGARGVGGYYRPVINVSLAVDLTLYGSSAPGFRVTNVLGHLLSTLLVFAIGARRLAFTPATAATAAALFLLHPFHDQAVLWVAGRTDVLCTVFALTAFLLTTRGDRAGRVCGALAFALALGAKEMAATLPLVVACFAWCRDDGADRRRRLGDAIRLALPLFAVLALFLSWRAWIVGGLGGDPAFRNWDAAVLKSTAKLLAWLLVPVELSEVKRALRGDGALLYAASAVWLAALLAVAWALRNVRAALFAALWVAVTLVPVHGRPAAWYLYLPSAGSALLMAAVLHAGVRGRWARSAIAIGLAVAFAAGLHRNARSMASAASIGDDAVAFFARQPAPAWLLNAPIVLGGRIPILTSEEQYAIALALRGETGSVIPLNYVYVGSPLEPRTEIAIDGQRMDLAVETSPDTFFTLDGVFASPPSRPARGLTLRGTHATYVVSELNAQEKIRRVTLLDVPPAVTSASGCLAEFREGRFRPVTACAR